MQKISRYRFFIAIISLVLMIALAAWYFNIVQYLSLSVLQSKLAYLRAAVRDCYFCVLAVYVGIYILAASFMIPSLGPLTLVGGYLFGALVGFCAAMGSLLCGIGISFIAIRYACAEWLPARWQARKEKFVVRVREHGAWYIFILNLVTVVPFVVITTLAALSEISFWKFIGASLLGSAPMIGMYAFAGRQLADITSLGQLFSPAFAGVLLLMGSLSFIPLIIKRFTRMSIDDV